MTGSVSNFPNQHLFLFLNPAFYKISASFPRRYFCLLKILFHEKIYIGFYQLIIG